MEVSEITGLMPAFPQMFDSGTPSASRLRSGPAGTSGHSLLPGLSFQPADMSRISIPDPGNGNGDHRALASSWRRASDRSIQILVRVPPYGEADGTPFNRQALVEYANITKRTCHISRQTQKYGVSDTLSLDRYLASPSTVGLTDTPWLVRSVKWRATQDRRLALSRQQVNGRLSRKLDAAHSLALDPVATPNAPWLGTDGAKTGLSATSSAARPCTAP